MKRILFWVGAFILIAGHASAQNCTQTLRTARATYEQGRLHEIEGLLEGCLANRNGFTATQRVEAYRILVLTYIYLEEPQKADAAMLKLLSEDHFFKINPVSDPIEFQSLYKKFRTKPLFQVGLKFGVNNSQINVMKNYYVWAYSQGKGEYTSNVSIQLGLVFEKNLTPRIIANPEIFYSTASFNYQNSSISRRDTIAENVDNSLFKTTQQRLQFNAMFQYSLAPESKFAPYVAIGPGIGYLMNATTGGELLTGSTTTIPNLPISENYRKLNFSAVVSAGIKYQVGSFFLTADVRYLKGLGNIVNTEKRYEMSATNEELLNNGYIHNDFSLSQAMVNVGLIVPYFNPKKLIR